MSSKSEKDATTGTEEHSEAEEAPAPKPVRKSGRSTKTKGSRKRPAWLDEKQRGNDGGMMPGAWGQGQQQQQQQQQSLQQQGGKKGGGQDPLKLRLDLNLDIEIQLKARIHGDLTLTLLG